LKPFGDPAVLICTGFLVNSSNNESESWQRPSLCESDQVLFRTTLCLQVSLRVSFAHGLRKFTNQSQVLTHLTQVFSFTNLGHVWMKLKCIEIHNCWPRSLQLGAKGQVSTIRIARFFAMFARFFKIAQGFCLGKTIWHVLLSFFQRCQVFSQGFHHLPHFCRDLLLFTVGLFYICVSHFTDLQSETQQYLLYFCLHPANPFHMFFLGVWSCFWEAENANQENSTVPTLTELWEASSGHRASATAAFAHFGTLLQQQAETRATSGNCKQ
jgi:hypothetical protein